MAQQKTIKFSSTTTTKPDGELIVFSDYRPVWVPGRWIVTSYGPVWVPGRWIITSIHKGEIPEEVKTENSVSSLEGNLIIAMEDNLVNCSIDINGNLLILCEDAENYSINENGELIYNYSF